MRENSFHDFYAPIDGTAVRFSMKCVSGSPKSLQPAEPLPQMLPGAHDKILGQIDLINHLLKSLPWAALATTQRAGNIGAVIEAAEARRLEIYGRQSDGEQAA